MKCVNEYRLCEKLCHPEGWNIFITVVIRRKATKAQRFLLTNWVCFPLKFKSSSSPRGWKLFVGTRATSKSGCFQLTLSYIHSVAQLYLAVQCALPAFVYENKVPWSWLIVAWGRVHNKAGVHGFPYVVLMRIIWPVIRVSASLRMLPSGYRVIHCEPHNVCLIVQFRGFSSSYGVISVLDWVHTKLQGRHESW